MQKTKPGHLLTKAKINYQLPAEILIGQTIQRNEGVISDNGALVVCTGEFTGRSPADKFIVKDELTVETVDWNKFNTPIEESYFLMLRDALINYLDKQTEVWVRDVYACANPAFRLPVQVINEFPWCNHFAANMFIDPTEHQLKNFDPEWTIVQAPGFKAEPKLHGTRRGNFTIISFTHKTILIGGSGYTGEIKKGVFTVLNFILPLQNKVLSMHCSANEGIEGDTALFFGLSGTGKTTLSSDPLRKLIGDDEHGWDDKGIFNFEGGCYAKVIKLSAVNEPDIFNAIRKGALVENTQFFEGTNSIDFADKTITENTRVSYPLSYITGAKSPSISGTPTNLFFLACDAYGVFPPISKLDYEQAMYYFINGYTAKIAGTEVGVNEPQITFSTCFGAPFLSLHPYTYASLLKEKLEAHETKVWLINTGWTGGCYGTGHRISIAYTRAMITAALNGQLDSVTYKPHPIFEMLVPQSCPGVPDNLLNPSGTWADKQAYDKTAADLAEKFKANYRQYENVMAV